MNRFSIHTLQAIRLFCVDYHGGQWSRLYRLQCRISSYFRRKGIKPIEYFGELPAKAKRLYLRLTMSDYTAEYK